MGVYRKIQPLSRYSRRSLIQDYNFSASSRAF